MKVIIYFEQKHTTSHNIGSIETALTKIRNDLNNFARNSKSTVCVHFYFTINTPNTIHTISQIVIKMLINIFFYVLTYLTSQQTQTPL